MKANDVNSILFNPVWTSRLLHYFLSGAYSIPNKNIKFELIYLVLPFIYDDLIFEKLKRLNKNSSFNSLFKNEELKNCLIRKDEQMVSFTDITNDALIYLGNQTQVYINKYIKAQSSLEYQNKNENPFLKDYYKAAYNLGLIFAKEDYLTIFLRIGAKS